MRRRGGIVGDWSTAPDGDPTCKISTTDSQSTKAESRLPAANMDSMCAVKSSHAAGEYLQVRKQGNINPLPDPRWHEVFCQVTPEENTEPASLDQT